MSEALSELQALARRLRELIASQPPRELLGYIYAALLLGYEEDETTADAMPSGAGTLPKQSLEEGQFLLEYIHAVLATTLLDPAPRFDQSVAAQIFDLSEQLRGASLTVAMMIAARSSETQFGPSTRSLLFHALSTWVLMRGHRYQALEEEFFDFALFPHDEALRHAYGVGSQEIAAGIQAFTDAVLLGHVKAFRVIEQSREDAIEFAAAHEQPMKEIIAEWKSERADSLAAAQEAFADLFQGGICNVSRHTQLPTSLLDDLSYSIAEETEFFAPGEYSGTPFLTLPARKKPLIKLDGEHYLTDPSFARDAAYRAILHNLLNRHPEYGDNFKLNQKQWSESAFANIFKNQLKGATILNEVYYRRDGNWYENDTVILLDGVLILVEAKSGAAATIASPASNFERHARTLRDLIVKAYEQCRRFLEYLQSAKEVPLFALNAGRYEEVARIRLSDFWLVLPVGLTVESYSPFSTSSKQLPGVAQILGRYPFISVAIDELMVVSRFLPNAGALMHYLRIRQEVAGIKEVFLFDELDHLGAYITKNRFFDELRPQIDEGANWIVVDGMSSVIDDYFSHAEWAQMAPPAQECPQEVRDLLDALERTHAPGWIEADSHLRDFGLEGRNDMATQLEPLRKSLREHPHRYFALRSDIGLFFWLHRGGISTQLAAAELKAQTVAVSLEVDQVLLILAEVDERGRYSAACPRWIRRPSEVSDTMRADAAALSRRSVNPAMALPVATGHTGRKLGRNDPCWCGNGKKFKKCHGR
ncbi:SEC-C domain-containing protein [Lysobacter sp. ESA13C]|uniref:SEC-C metal-binding domain-containing protein n=1 Tax=Lysobacter sp. ESA13C TaxID=2862676 RepID=UPI001CC034B9